MKIVIQLIMLSMFSIMWICLLSKTILLRKIYYGALSFRMKLCKYSL